MNLSSLLITTESATYMTPERVEQIRGKIKSQFDDIGYNRITDIDVCTTNGYQIQVNFDGSTHESDVQKAREVCKEVLGNNWIESNTGDNQLMFIFGGGNESCSNCDTIDVTPEEFLEMTPKEQKEFMKKQSKKKFDEKDVALEDPESDEQTLGSCTAQEGFFSNLKKKKEEKKNDRSINAAAYNKFIEEYGPKCISILKTTQNKIANRIKRELADVSGWQTYYEINIRNLDIDDLFDYGCYLVTIEIKSNDEPNDDKAHMKIYNIKNELDKILQECGKKLCDILPGNCKYNIRNESGDDTMWETNICITDYSYDEFETTAQESVAGDLVKEAVKNPVAIGAGIAAAIGIGVAGVNAIKNIIEKRHKDLLNKRKEEAKLKKTEKEAKETRKDQMLMAKWESLIKMTLSNVSSNEVNIERKLRSDEYKKIKAIWQKYLNKISKEYPGFGSNFDVRETDSDVNDFFNMDILSYITDNNIVSLGCDLDVQYWVYKKYTNESNTCDMNDKSDPIRKLCDEMKETAIKYYNEFIKECKGFKTITVVLSEWSKYEGYGLLTFHNSAHFGEICRSCGYQSFDTWKKNQ